MAPLLRSLTLMRYYPYLVLFESHGQCSCLHIIGFESLWLGGVFFSAPLEMPVVL
jgi:hypothetical protein